MSSISKKLVLRFGMQGKSSERCERRDLVWVAVVRKMKRVRDKEKKRRGKEKKRKRARGLVSK